VHVQTVGATVNLRCAHPDEIEQLMVEPSLAHLPFKAEHRLDDAWVHVHKFDASFHDVLTSMIKDESESQSVTTTPESRSFCIAGQRHPSAMPTSAWSYCRAASRVEIKLATGAYLRPPAVT
jgi:hypothetical protein